MYMKHPTKKMFNLEPMDSIGKIIYDLIGETLRLVRSTAPTTSIYHVCVRSTAVFQDLYHYNPAADAVVVVADDEPWLFVWDAAGSDCSVGPCPLVPRGLVHISQVAVE